MVWYGNAYRLYMGLPYMVSEHMINNTPASLELEHNDGKLTFGSIETQKIENMTVTSPNIAWPLTLCTSPCDYSIFDQVNSLFYYLISGCFWKEKKAKKFSRYAFTSEQEWILAKI